MTEKEARFQKNLIAELKSKFPGCIVRKNETTLHQGFPDLLILYGSRWATLECKRSENAPRRPNQDHWVRKLDDMSFSRFIYPENKEEVLSELQRAFKTSRTARVSRSK